VDAQEFPLLKCTVESALHEWDLPDEFIQQLLSVHTPVNYEKGSVLFVNGTPADIFFLVFDGVVRVYASQSDGQQSTFMLAGPGDFLGFANSNDRNGKIHCLDAIAVTKCSVALFTRRFMVQLLARLSSPTLVRLIEDMNAAWSKALLWHIDFFRLSFLERFALVLHELGLKFGKPSRNGVLLSLKLGHDDFAEMIGCSRPVISKILLQLISAGAVEVADRSGIIVREPLLAAVANRDRE
jgi:CRP/FNR family transcriptional regulator, cyclic AMP receptor protein